MFETTVVRTSAAAAPRRVGFLSVSLAAHTLVAGGIVFASIATVKFPTQMPRDTAVFLPTTTPAVPAMPLPKGNPNAERKPEVQAPAKQPIANPRVVTAPPDTAPTQIPETVVPVTNTSTAGFGEVSGPVSDGAGDRWGVPDGDPNAIDVGQVVDGPATAAPEMIFVPGGEVKSAVVIHRAQPHFPQIAVSARRSGVVKIKCIIDGQGNVKNPEIIHSSWEVFDAPALAALQQWRFAPGTLRGKPVDTWFELTINFSVR